MCRASHQLPKLSLLEYHISWELGTDRNFVLAGWFWQIKNSRLPSADMVGLSSGKSELILMPRFSILTIVEAVMMLAAWGTNAIELSKAVCDTIVCAYKYTISVTMVFFTYRIYTKTKFLYK